MISIYIHPHAFDSKKPLSLKNGSRVSVPNEFIKCQLEILRGDVNWILSEGEKIEKFDAIVRLNSSKVDADLESLNKVEVQPGLVLSLEVDKELRFVHDDVSEEDKGLTLKTEEQIQKKILKHFPNSRCAVLVEIGDDREGHKKNKIWLSFLGEKMKSPFLLHFSSADRDKLIERSVEKLASIKPKKVFITRDLDENDGLKLALEKNKFQISGIALTEHKIVAINKAPVFDWAFFSNVRSVKYFFMQKPELGKAKIGAISKSVADEIRKYGKRAAFIGGSDSSMVGRQFGNVAGGEKIIFPKGRSDGRSVQMQVKGQNNMDLIVYETLRHPDHKIPKNDILVFTSPANVMAYLEKNPINDEKVIAYGDATMKTLKAKGVYSVFPTYSFDNIGIARAIYSASI